MCIGRTVGVVVLLSGLLGLSASAGMAQEKIALPFAERQARATLQMSNDVLDLYFNERYSDTWLFEYSPGVQGESCYYEHFAIWTPGGIRESDGFTVQQEFSTPSGGVSTCVVRSDPFEVKRSVSLGAGAVPYFEFTYRVKNVGASSQTDVRFFEAIDFDIPDTGDCTDDYGQYDAASRATSIVDYEYFRDTVTATPLPNQHGLDHWSIEINEDWDDGVLNSRSWYGPGDPGLALGFNLGNLAPGQQKEIKIRVRFDVESAADLQVDKVEINQAFQDKDVMDPGAVPLVAGKPMVFRAYVDIGPVAGPVPGVTGKLHILRNGVEISDSPYSPTPGSISALKDPLRVVTADTLNFYVTGLPGGDYTAFVIIDPGNTVYESNDDNNRYPAIGEFTFAVHQRDTVKLIYYKIEQESSWPSSTRVADAPFWLEKVYPTAEVDYVSLGGLAQAWGGDLDYFPWTNVALASLAMRRAEYNIFNNPDAAAVVGWLPEVANGGQWWGVTNPMPLMHSCLVYDDEDYYETTLAHEVGHTYGLNFWGEEYNDPNAQQIGEGGFDVPGKAVVSSYKWNFMNNDSTANSWVSRSSYEQLYGALPRSPVESRSASQEYVIVSGTIDRLDTVTLNPLYRLWGETTPSPFAGGSYALRFLDAGGQVLASYAFDPDFRILGVEGETDMAPFVFVVPYPEGTKSIVVEKISGVQGRSLLAEVVVSPNPPVVQVVYPNGGEALSGVVNVAWTGHDVDGDALHYCVFYSPNVEEWLPIGQDIEGTSCAWDTSGVAGGTACKIRIVASDGINTSEDVSDGFFNVLRKDPVASIQSPANGATVKLGEVLSLTGIGYDLEDRFLSGAALSWSSSLDGTLGSGEALSTTTLSEGQHAITLTAIDSDGATGTDQIALTVVADTTPPEPPTNLLTSIVGAELALTWTPSLSGDATGYILRLGEAPGVYYLVRDIGNLSEWRTGDLSEGRTYYMALSAYDWVGNESVLSEEVSVHFVPQCGTEVAQLGQPGWHMVSLPGALCEPCRWMSGECGDLECALGDDLDPFFAYRYDAALGAYVRVPPADRICHQPSMGLWIYTYDYNTLIDADVTPFTDPVELALQEGWNQVGDPYTFSVDTSSMRVRCGTQELSLVAAQAQGWVSATLYGYDTASKAYVAIEAAAGCIPAWTGCWIRTYRDDCTLVFQPVGCALSAPQAHPLSKADALALELPPPPPLDLQGLDIKEVLAELSVCNVPNPIRSEHTTVFRVQGLAAELVSEIRVDIYDLSGVRVFTQRITAKELAWHTANDAGELLANGVYLYQVWVKIDEIWYPMEIQKVVVLR